MYIRFSAIVINIVDKKCLYYTYIRYIIVLERVVVLGLSTETVYYSYCYIKCFSYFKEVGRVVNFGVKKKKLLEHLRHHRCVSS